jgi:hypothetical protein
MQQSQSGSSEGLKLSLCRLDHMLEAEFQRMQAAGQLQDHPARGLFLDPAYVRTLLHVEDTSSREVHIQDFEGSLATLGDIFSLSALELNVLLLAVAPEIDPRYESIFAYLHNDVTRKKPSIGLAVRLFLGGDSVCAEALRCFHSTGTLLREHLLTLNGDCFPSRTITADTRLASFLLGGDLLDERLLPWTTIEGGGAELPFPPDTVRIWRRAFKDMVRAGGLMLLRGRPGAGKRTIVASICQQNKTPLLVARPSDIQPTTLGLLRREARLRNAAVYLALPPGSLLETVLGAFENSRVTIVCGSHRRHDDDHLADYSFDIPALASGVQRNLWHNAFEMPGEGVDEVAAKFSLTAGQIARAGRDAARRSKLRGADRISEEDLHHAARNQAGSGLLRLATRVELSFGWDDLVLPQHLIAQLHEICTHVRHREKVYHQWGFSSRLGPARGIAALFAGPSGTGKTMSAGVLARELGLELYRIDLATVVSKYIGETEKNLSRIFEEAEDSNAILLFDEADALFGKRSEVKDAHDRYANLEVAYLLQRMETYSGVAILATNLAANLDEAFARRMAHLVEFPFPDASLRERLWRKSIPARAPLSTTVNFTMLANQFHISGGNIRNITLAAAFLASEQDCAIGMEQLIRAIARELEKIGRQPSRAEFNEFYPLVEHRQ